MQYRKENKKDFLDFQAHLFAWALLALLADTTETNLENTNSCSVPSAFVQMKGNFPLARTDVREMYYNYEIESNNNFILANVFQLFVLDIWFLIDL